jgi:hypothetical protein
LASECSTNARIRRKLGPSKDVAVMEVGDTYIKVSQSRLQIQIKHFDICPICFGVDGMGQVEEDGVPPAPGVFCASLWLEGFEEPSVVSSGLGVGGLYTFGDLPPVGTLLAGVGITIPGYFA